MKTDQIYSSAQSQARPGPTGDMPAAKRMKLSESAAAAPGHKGQTSRTANGLHSLGTVDSGIGGAMAGMLISGPLKHLAAQTCLPIGDKTPNQVISFTAQMSAQGLIGEGHDNIIVACNTASTSKPFASRLVTDFIMQQDVSPTPIYQEDSAEMQRIHSLANEIRAEMSSSDPEAHYAVMDGKIHEVVSPTAEAAAKIAAKGLLSSDGPSEFLVVVDSTKATAGTGLYPSRISGALDAMMADAGYSRTTPGAADHRATKEDIVTDPALAAFQRTTVDVQAFTYSKGSDTKSLIVQGRGHPSWVPNIEGGKLNTPSGVGQATIVETLANAADAAGRSVTLEGADARVNAALQRKPDLMMMCCTHFPAMVKGLKGQHGADTDILTQDVVVKQMAEQITGESIGEVTEHDTLAITRGEAVTTPQDAKAASDAVRNVHPTNPRPIDVEAMGADRFPDYQNMHRQMHFNADQLRNGDSVESNLLHKKEAGVHALWSQDKAAENRQNRTDVFMEASLKTSLPGQTPHKEVRADMSSFDRREAIAENAEIDRLNALASKTRDAAQGAQKRLQSLGLSATQIRLVHNKIASIARAVTEGETRGVNILASRQEPGLEMLSSAVAVADVIANNREIESSGSGRMKTNVGIVTGFTVVNPRGEKVGGENDGPPGAVVMAKQMVEHGTPVTLICDEHNEASVFAAAKAAGLVRKNANGETAPSERRFAGSDLADGLTVEVFRHGPELSADDKSRQEQMVRASLEVKNTGLMISIERPSVSKDGNMSSMIGADISRFNANLSGLFTSPISDVGGKPVTSIGIGDGGNEIGTGRVSPETSHMRKPNYAPVVNNGDKIAAATATDHMVLASVSNNGGVALAMSVATVLNELPRPETADGTAEPRGNARSIVEGYKAVIDGLFDEGMSTDGVNKVNAKTVDGRTLHRNEADGPQTIGSPLATHDDMFDHLVRLSEAV